MIYYYHIFLEETNKKKAGKFDVMSLILIYFLQFHKNPLIY